MIVVQSRLYPDIRTGILLLQANDLRLGAKSAHLGLPHTPCRSPAELSLGERTEARKSPVQSRGNAGTGLPTWKYALMEIGALCPVRSLSSHVQFPLERAHQLVTRGNNVAPRLLGRIQCQTELP